MMHLYLQKGMLSTHACARTHAHTPSPPPKHTITLPVAPTTLILSQLSQAQCLHTHLRLDLLGLAQNVLHSDLAVRGGLVLDWDGPVSVC